MKTEGARRSRDTGLGSQRGLHKNIFRRGGDSLTPLLLSLSLCLCLPLVLPLSLFPPRASTTRRSAAYEKEKEKKREVRAEAPAGVERRGNGFRRRSDSRGTRAVDTFSAAARSREGGRDRRAGYENPIFGDVRHPV